MILTDDFIDFLKLLQQQSVKFLICGGHAVSFHGYPRTTLDFDVLFDVSEENANKIISVLEDFGFGSIGIPREAFLKKGTAITLGAQPNQIDLLTSINGESNENIFKNAVKGNLEGFDVLYISREDLIKSKKAVGRLKDLADIEELEKIENGN